MHKNHAFLNMEKSPINFREVAPGEDWGLENETGYALNFWNTDEYGDTIKDIDPHNYKKYYLYAMNIHLILPKAKLAAAKPPAPPGTVIVPDGTPQDAFLPIILDPDTGNMGGTP